MRSTNNLTPPPSYCTPTCRRGQMSKWRQKGFVQDSDEEEEDSQLESQGSKRDASLNRRVERVDGSASQGEEADRVENDSIRATETREQETNGDSISLQVTGKVEHASPATRRLSPSRPTASPLTPAATYHSTREPTDSPDPLQGSPSPRPQKHRLVAPSQLLEAPLLDDTFPPLGAQQQDNALRSPHVQSRLVTEVNSPTPNDTRTDRPPNILDAFGVEPLSEDSDDEPLSDPPSDLESPEPGFLVPQPHRRTAVQVVIPSSTALQRHLYEEEARREFRQRKPIQLHPYALEGELYRREVQSRGLKPVPRPRSPEQRVAPQNTETQEKDFDPNATPDSSPPEVEIPVSTPAPRKPRADKSDISSTRRPVSDLTRRKLPATQLHLPNATKRRRLNVSSTQAAAAPTNIFDDEAARHDIWSILPNSPPYSSSPHLLGQHSGRNFGKFTTAATTQNLPTPSTSSIFQDEPPQMPDSDVDRIPRGTAQADSELRRPARIILSDLSSSESDSSSSEAEKSDHELRQVSRKIKGVLPASWLRFDQQAQERLQAQARERERARQLSELSPDPEPQRGVAQRIIKRNVSGGRQSTQNMPAKDVVLISDGSGDERQAQIYKFTRDVRTSVDDARALAAELDRRYAEYDSDNMENDPLPLFTMGGTGSKRKRQSKLTDAFTAAKRRKAANGTARLSHSIQPRKKQHNGRSKHTRCTPPPALSVVDVDMSSSKDDGSMPQFLRLARRQALRRPDLARQSPWMKQVRLHNSRDTEEANATLQQWRKGGLRPNAKVAPRKLENVRSPLADRSDNQQHAQGSTQNRTSPGKDLDTIRISTSQRLTTRPLTLAMFQRTSTQASNPSKRIKSAPRSNTILQRSAHTARPPFRVGQLEGDEQVFGHGHRKIAFEKGLRHADRPTAGQGPGNHVYMNPQLARFLADDDAVLPPLPSAKDIGEQRIEREREPVPPSRKRLTRKKLQAQRVDVDAREFRQPSEQAVQEVLFNQVHNRSHEAASEEGPAILRGLGPFGTRYPTTFDVVPLQADTYFHSSTLVGSEDLRRALSVAQADSRNLDDLAGYCTITHSGLSVRCGPWNDETSSALANLVRSITAPLGSDLARSAEEGCMSQREVLRNLAQFVRSMTSYVSTNLSFSDPVDRRSFVVKMQQVLFTLFDQVSVLHHNIIHNGSGSDVGNSSLRAMIFLLVLSVQTSLIAQNTVVDQHLLLETRRLAQNIATAVISHIIRSGASELGDFLEQNKRHAVRQNGVREKDAVVEGVVVCMHALETLALPAKSFWDIVSQELAPAATVTNVTVFETAWATLFSLVPFIEVDVSGIPVRSRRESFSLDNWTCISTILRRLFELYQSTYRKHGSSLNDYVRASLARCHRLIKFWHWRKPEQMLNVVFDFFGRNGLKQLHRESTSGSVTFFDHATAEQPLSLDVNECSFHVALKCLMLGLYGMRKSYAEKKIRSFVFRTIPNHGRSYPKDQPLDEESLAALRNHHDLLCTLYWAAPPPCRPKLELIRGLVSHETSHREACRVNVRAWANLTAYQLSTAELYEAAKPFALWHKDIMHQTLKQYRLAKSEADDYIKSGALDGTTDVSTVMVRQTMERNQEQVIATLRDCIQGMQKAMQSAADQTTLGVFLVNSDVMQLLELPHLEDGRLVNVIRDVLALLQKFLRLQKSTTTHKESQTASEDSQDYGDFPDMDDLDDLEQHNDIAAPQHKGLDFIQSPLWHLLSNAFGAEMSPDDNLLLDCVDTWSLFAQVQVTTGARSWSYFLDSFSQKSWQQLRQTEQSRKFAPYFLARLADSDRMAYEHHQHDFNNALLLSLVDRESMLRFQHRLLHAIVTVDKANPLMKNLPFFCDPISGNWDITSDTLRSRRLALISSILSNMRDELHLTAVESMAQVSEVRRAYTTMLQEFMMRMKGNYLQLQQGATVTGAYVDFVQKIVQFLKQYTGDICPVIPFFTDSVAFPLPSKDPTYVVGRLCGYAPKAMEPGTSKQLSVFIQTVAQQAAADHQQQYLVTQLTTAVCSNETPAADRTALRSVLLQSIFPSYLERSFSTGAAFLIANPILQCLRPILDTMIFDLRITRPDSVSTIMNSIIAVAHAFIRGTEHLKDSPTHFKHPYVLAASTYTLGAMGVILPVLEYICSQTGTKMHPLVAYMRDFSMFVMERLRDMEPQTIPDYEGDAHTTTAGEQHSNLLAFCRRGLEDSLKANWSEDATGTVHFGQGHARKEVVFDIGSVEEERERLLAAVEAFQSALCSVYGEGDFHENTVDLAYHVVV
ncbi:hypothetical protein HBH92_085230 [Parastagonospora nodorum]|nr:hypothetical protein HBH52_061840 [Parastagonospora nodorum]KAH4065752.1 hypothetical protein HBH50_160750 [Parastagonospora nodorum]KAH4092241.1 hypothetical protein HBH48_083810 [Parastagonospora nodorum]KAH4414165.1 hypothetical protein HBH92_085230 [Parastagonospora nodorum]KAH4437792.1 hypothetical protein HBH93_100760 [Parastagonospora nodorum]